MNQKWLSGKRLSGNSSMMMMMKLRTKNYELKPGNDRQAFDRTHVALYWCSVTTVRVYLVSIPIYVWSKIANFS